jgi:hypothetical protein
VQRKLNRLLPRTAGGAPGRRSGNCRRELTVGILRPERQMAGVQLFVDHYAGELEVKLSTCA